LFKISHRLVLILISKEIAVNYHYSIHTRNFTVIPSKKNKYRKNILIPEVPAVLFCVHLFSCGPLNARGSSSELFKILKLEWSLKFSFLVSPPFGSHIKTHSTNQFLLISGRAVTVLIFWNKDFQTANY